MERSHSKDGEGETRILRVGGHEVWMKFSVSYELRSPNGKVVEGHPGLDKVLRRAKRVASGG